MAKKITNPEDLDTLRDRAREEMDPRTASGEMQMTVHMGTCGIAAGARDVLSQLVASRAFVSNVQIRQSGCGGFCEQEPMLSVKDKAGKTYVYGKLNRAKVQQIIREHVLGGHPVARFLVGKEQS